MAVVVHGIKDGVDQALETVSAIIGRLEALPEPSLEHEQTCAALKEAQTSLTRAREKAEAAARRTRSRTIRG